MSSFPFETLCPGRGIFAITVPLITVPATSTNGLFGRECLALDAAHELSRRSPFNLAHARRVRVVPLDFLFLPDVFAGFPGRFHPFRLGSRPPGRQCWHCHLGALPTFVARSCFSWSFLAPCLVAVWRSHLPPLLRSLTGKVEVGHPPPANLLRLTRRSGFFAGRHGVDWRKRASRREALRSFRHGLSRGFICDPDAQWMLWRRWLSEGGASFPPLLR